MARVGGVRDFWNILKSVSVTEIARQANRPLSIGLVGDSSEREQIQKLLMTGDETLRLEDLDIKRISPPSTSLQIFESTSEEAGFPRQAGMFDFTIDVGAGRIEEPEGAAIYSIAELGGWEATVARILEDRPELALPLARSFPAFRKPVAEQIIHETAVANAQFALITGISEAIPITAILLPVNSLSDIVMLTKNQAMMTLRLAAAYNLDLDYKSRLKEVAPILGNAFGWRAIARELVGAVPFIGFLVRASIAYAGTMTVGKGVMYYYETGENLTSSQAKRLYREAYQNSRQKIQGLARSIREKAAAASPKELSNSAGVVSTELMVVEPDEDLDLIVPAEGPVSITVKSEETESLQ